LQNNILKNLINQWFNLKIQFNFNYINTELVEEDLLPEEFKEEDL